MRNITAGIITIIVSITSCQPSQLASRYEERIGNIPFDPQTDRKDFHLCNPNTIQQYFAFTSAKHFKDYKPFVDSLFFATFHSVPIDESGLIRIRFIVNCKGETDRFRIIAMNKQYKPIRFNKRITNSLLAITKSIKVWQVQMVNGKPIDYYQYLIFKISKGKLTEILP